MISQNEQRNVFEIKDHTIYVIRRIVIRILLME